MVRILGFAMIPTWIHLVSQREFCSLNNPVYCVHLLPCRLPPVIPWCIRLPLHLSNRTHVTQVVARLATLTWLLVLGISLENSQLPSRAGIVIGPWKEHVRVIFYEYTHSERLIVWYVVPRSQDNSRVAALEWHRFSGTTNPNIPCA